jgi:hypothetical protein
MASLSELTMDRVKEIVEATFVAADWTVEYDKLPRAAGHEGTDRLAVYPEAEREKPGQVEVLIAPVVLQIYPAYVADIDEHQQVDPRIIVRVGEELRDAFQNASGGVSSDLWFLRLLRIEYPDDPTGNRSRLEAYIEGYGNNSAGIPA